jgi:hexosaminidase
MFPYSGLLKDVRSPNCYSKDQINQLVNLCKVYKLKLAVLVQTFGHLEYVLKHSRYKNYSEEADNPISLCSLEQESLSLVMQIV